VSQKIVVIGSNCFSGAQFVDYCLEQGYEVLGISRSLEYADVFLPYKLNRRSGFTFRALDLNLHSAEIATEIQNFQASYVVNFAAQGMVAESWQNPIDWFTTNTIGHIALHDKLRKFDFIKKYVHISTPEVYGSTEGRVQENFPYNPSTPYAVSKAACDMSLKTFFKNYSFPVASTRAANVYGSCQALYRIIPKTVFCILLGKKLPLHGGGHSVRAFIHMRDVSAGTLKVATDGNPGDIYHFSTDRFIAIRDLVKMICDILGVKFEDAVDIVGERPGKDAYYVLDSAKARNELAWSDKISLEQGVEETIRWIKDNLEELKKHPDIYIHKK
jgi:dTDP-glucose 4,6-dehydratase